MNLAKESLLGVPITTAPETEILPYITSSIKEKHSLFITTPNPEIIVEAKSNAEFKHALNDSDISLPDGTGVILAFHIKGIAVSRIRGRELFERLLELANINEWKVYVLGAGEESNRETVDRINKTYPGITILGNADCFIDKAGNWAPENSTSEESCIQKILEFAPQLLFVALGHPKQELWTTRVKHNFPGTTIMTVGGTLDYFSGKTNLPPKFVATIGLEWLYRLIKEPKRINRILTALLVFPWYVITGI